MNPLGKQLIRFLFFFLISATAIFAAQLPVRIYTSADGLASSAVTFITRDSQGFLWFCTRDGLSRFDGREFVNYRLGDNPAALTFWALVETRDGNFWISTSDGIYRLNPHQAAKAEPENPGEQTGEVLNLHAEKVSDKSPALLLEDSAGRLWGSGSGGVILIAQNGQLVMQDFNPAKLTKLDQPPVVNTMTEARDGSLWFGCDTGVIRLLTNGKLIYYPVRPAAAFDLAPAITEDEQGRIWLGHKSGAFVIVPESVDPPDNFTERVLPVHEQILADSGSLNFSAENILHLKIPNSAASSSTNPFLQVNALYKAFDKKLWLAPLGDFLYVFDNEKYSRLQDPDKFPIFLTRMTQDAAGNLWISSRSGAMKLSLHGFTTYSKAEGLSSPDIQSIYEGADGRIYVVYGIDWHIGRIGETGVETARLPLPETSKFLWTSNMALPDAAAAWWALTDNGLYRFPATSDFSALNRQPPQRIYTTGDGLKANSTYCGFRDSKGGLWFSTRGNLSQNTLTRFDPATETFHTFTAEEGFPEGQPAVSFAEAPNGDLWLGFYNGGLARYSNGRFTDFSKAEGLPQGGIFGLYFDLKDRLWLGTNQDGVRRVDDPSAESLTFVRYTTADGLRSNNVRSLTGDLNNNIYVGTVRGLSRISPESGRIRNYTMADGLAGDFVKTAFRDRQGSLWFGTDSGVSRLKPDQDMEKAPVPQIWISGLNIAGVRYHVSEFGQTEVGQTEVGFSENNLKIDFLGVGENLRYQYRLEGAGSQDWTPPTEQRTVDFANLAPGTYRFMVRAVGQDGQVSPNPATVSVKIRPPFWQTRWFIALVILIVGLSVFALDRYRVAKTRQVQAALTDLQKSEKERRQVEAALQKSREDRLAELERVRTRIATDLHDDIGSSLTQIAVLSQVANGGEPQNGSLLETISETSVELVAAMSDVVWAINPRKDNLNDLIFRMRRFAADILTARQIHFEFHTPDTETNMSLGANIRREVFVIFKECINNIVKHAGPRNVGVKFHREENQMSLEINDDGRGFDVEKALAESSFHAKGGNGLPNIQRRAKELGGECEILSEPGRGTTIHLRLPLPASSGETNQMGRENEKDNELN